jgi:hypothetical protein
MENCFFLVTVAESVFLVNCVGDMPPPHIDSNDFMPKLLDEHGLSAVAKGLPGIAPLEFESGRENEMPFLCGEIVRNMALSEERPTQLGGVA